MTKIELCFIEDFPSLKEGIFAISPISKNGLKKLGLNKNFLNKPIIAKDHISIPIDILNSGLINSIYDGEEVKIIFEDEKFIVFSKPPKIHSHPLSYDESNNLLSYIATIKPQLLRVNSNNYDRGLIYRLDYETSGLMYYAKDDETYNWMRKNFNEIIKEKRYIAVVSGDIKSQIIHHNLVVSEVKGSVVKDHPSGKPCSIDVKQLDYNSDLNRSLVSINLKEGFKHQIRAQLSLEGHSIVGDKVYSGQEHDRLMLHCYSYKFDYKKSYFVEDSTTALESFLADFNCKL